jgi:hypothetical protein
MPMPSALASSASASGHRPPSRGRQIAPMLPASTSAYPRPVAPAPIQPPGPRATSCVPRKSSCAASAAARASRERSSGFSPCGRVGVSALKLTCRMGGDHRGDRVRRVRGRFCPPSGRCPKRRARCLATNGEPGSRSSVRRVSVPKSTIARTTHADEAASIPLSSSFGVRVRSAPPTAYPRRVRVCAP